MILESNINDESKVTFDCAKATIGKGSRISIDDIYWNETEIQNAIRMGLITLIGPIPILPNSTSQPERKIRFRNMHSSKLCFESFKDYADPGHIVWVPSSKVDEPEVRNAIAAGFLFNEDDPASTPPRTYSDPVTLIELTSQDLITDIPAKPVQELPAGIPEKRPTTSKSGGKIKAKKVASKSEPEEGEEEESSGLFRESEIIMPKEKASKPKPMPIAPPLLNDEEGADGEDDFDFTSVFSKSQPRNKR